MSRLAQVLQARQQQVESNFYNDYMAMMARSTQDVGSFGYDGVKVSFDKGASGLGDMASAWNTFSRSARSRGINPSYAQFAQMYNDAKIMESNNFKGELTKLELRGADASQIRKLARNDASFKRRLSDLSTSKFVSPEDQMIYQGLIPSDATSQFQKDLKNRSYPTSLALPAGLGAGAAFYASRPAGNIEDLTAARDLKFEEYKTSQRAFTDKANKLLEANKKQLTTSEKALKSAQNTLKRVDKVYTDPKQIKKMIKDGYKITKEGKIHRRSSKWLALQKTLTEEDDKITNLKRDNRKLRTGRASADDLVKAARNLKEGESSKLMQMLDKGGKWKAGAFLGASLGAGYVGGEIGRYLGGHQGARNLGADIAGVGAELGMGGASLYNAIKSPKVQKQLAKELMKHGTKEGLKRQGSKVALGRAVMSVLGKGAAKQVAGSSLLGIGNIAMALWTIGDIGRVVYNYSQGKYDQSEYDE